LQFGSLQPVRQSLFRHYNQLLLPQKLSSAEFSKAIADAVKTKTGDPTKSDGKKKPSQVFDWELEDMACFLSFVY
jgi:hypothetical protein